MQRVPGRGRRYLIAFALLAAFVAAGSWSEAEAAVLRVNNQAACSDATGSPNYCTINTAVTKAKPGDTVSVAAGTYHGKVYIDHSGTPGKPIQIVTTQGAVVRSESRGFEIAGASWIIIKGFSINWTESDGIRCTLCSNVDLIDNLVMRSRGMGVFINNASDVHLRDNRVRRSKFSGIEVASSSRVRIEGGLVAYSGSPVSGKSYKGIKLSNSTNSTIVGTKVFGNSDTGIYLLDGTTGVRIKGVIAHHNAREYDSSAAGIEIRSLGNIVEASTVFSNEDSGINLRWGGSDALIANNLAYWNGDHGIDVLESPRPRIVNNSVHDNGTAGINLEGNSYGGLVKNNISSDNGIGSTRTKGNIRITTSSTPSTTADRNIVYASDNGIIYQWGLTYFSKLSSMRNVNPGVEPNGYQSNPGWANAAGGDFHLTAGSKAIDSAQSDAIGSGEIDRDAAGNSRCDVSSVGNTGSGPVKYMDRGALEFVSGC